jgi:hypothetical protein
MKLDPDAVLNVWTDFSQSLRPEIDTVCFYPESALPFSKAEILLMLVDNYKWILNNAEKKLTETSKELSNYKDTYILFNSLATNVGYLAKFTNQINQKYLTRFGYQSIKALDSDQSMESLANILSEGPKSDPEKEQKLLLEFFKTIEIYSSLTGFNIQKLLEWNPVMAAALNRLTQK